MKKNSKKQTKRAEQAKVAAEQLNALQQRDASSLVIGMDLGDRTSFYCVRTLDQQQIATGTIATTVPGMAAFFQGMKRQRVVMETGTHSRWVAHLLDLLGHEAIVGNARKLKLITQNDQKSDKVDAGLLSKLGCVGTEWLYPVYRRSESVQRDLTMVRAREALMETRTGLINHVRGQVKSFGCRISVCDADRFVEVAQKELPEALRPALAGVLEILEELKDQLYRYDCQVKHACDQKYSQTKWVMQISGVGPLTALTYVLTIEDPRRFESSRDVGSYLGLVTKKRQSGKRDPQLGITKTGDELLRKLLVNCAHHILGHLGADSDLRRWGLNLVARGQKAGQQGARKRAAAAVARKLAVVMHRLWAEERKYEPLRNSQAMAPAA
jgi:transposase